MGKDTDQQQADQAERENIARQDDARWKRDHESGNTVGRTGWEGK